MLKIWLMNVNTLGEFITSEMAQRGMNVTEFARFVGVSHQIITKMIESDQSEASGYPEFKTLRKLARATGTSLSTLVILLVPEDERPNISPEGLILAERADMLTNEQREVLMTFIGALIVQNLGKLGNKQK